MRRYGKIDPDILEKLVLDKLYVPDGRVIVGPGVGEDAAVISVRGSRFKVVCSCDPITGTSEDIGWYAVHINANDVAAMGADPCWFVACILLPEWEPKLLKMIVDGIARASKEIYVTTVGGHTEVAPNVAKPIVVGTMIGEATKVYPSSEAKPGDAIVLLKEAGIEGTSIIATEMEERLRGKVERGIIESAKGMKKDISVIGASRLARSFSIHAMHDPTEGGILGGVWELARASGTGFVVYRERIPLRKETREICAALGIDPLRLISSGSLLVSAPPSVAERVVEEAEKSGMAAEIIGELTAEKEYTLVLSEKGETEEIRGPVSDELWRIVGGEG